MRGARKDEKARDERRRQLGLPDHVTLLPETAGDELHAAAQSYGGNFNAAWKHSRRQVAKESIFSQAAVAAATGARHKKRPAAGAAAAGSGFGSFGSSGAAQKQRRLAPNVKLRLSDPKAA
jgi:coiled-coil domain-containing protein 130